jgi:hypothetical protein
VAAERWTAEDSQERRDRIKDADVRLDAWGRWSRVQMRVGGASSSNWFMALNPAPAEESQAGAKHVAEGCPDEEAMQVDAVVAHWMLENRGYWKIARREYLYYGPQEKKASDLGISRTEYRRLLDELRLALWRELALAAKYAIRSGKLDELPVKNARA